MALHNWAGSVTFGAERLIEPRSVAELQDAVSKSSRIRALGSGHSFSRVADTTGTLVGLAALDLPIEVCADAVWVPGGTRYGELAIELQRHGLALANLGSLPHICVAGACATGTHGSGVANECLAAAALAVEFVRADGALVELDAGDPDFPGAVLALGALGIVTRLRLAVEPSYQVRQDVWLDAPLDTVLGSLDRIMAAGYSVSLFSDFTRSGLLDAIWVKTRGGDPVDARQWGARPAESAEHPIRGVDPVAATAQLGVPGPWHERLPHFRLDFTPSSGDEQQSEYLVPRAAAADALAAIAAIDLSAALQVAEFRTVAADSLWLSPCHGRDTFALHFTWTNDAAAVARAVADVETALRPFDPRPHWGKVFGMAAETVRAGYPQLGEFAALAARHDPNRAFGNDFLTRYVY